MGVSNPSETPTLGPSGIVVEVLLFEKASQDRGVSKKLADLASCRIQRADTAHRKDYSCLVHCTRCCSAPSHCVVMRVVEKS
jgi:hypothetical protein